MSQQELGAGAGRGGTESPRSFGLVPLNKGRWHGKPFSTVSTVSASAKY